MIEAGEGDPTMPACHPDAVTVARPTRAHEQIFLMSKSPRYFYDADAIREPTGNELSEEEYKALTTGLSWVSGGNGNYAGGIGLEETSIHAPSFPRS